MDHEERPTAQPHSDSAAAVSKDEETQQQQPVNYGQDQYVGVPTGPASMDMSNMAAALPDYAYRQTHQPVYQQHPYSHLAQNPAMMYQYPASPYSGPVPSNYAMPFPGQTHSQGFSSQRQYSAYPITPNTGAGGQVYPGQTFYPHQSPVSPQMSGQFLPVSSGQPFGQMPGPVYGVRGPGHYQGAQLRTDTYGSNLPNAQAFPHNIRRTSSTSSLQASSALRGPPRKPKQSGHALWVGNLPPGTNILDLKDHFSRDATGDIESVFLISKSNCAFVNYKSESSCTAAMGRFHDSRFNGVRLVCRLRRGSSPVSALGSNSVSMEADGAYQSDSIANTADKVAEVDGAEEQPAQQRREDTKVKERYFIIKSLTIEDLERSVTTGIWATQSHNETVLNKAYQTAENVYLIFSANKSGEYFGYARMDSPIDDDPVPASELSSNEASTPQLPQSINTADLPLTIPTPATVTAPKGYIIDDSARGTIFWEADPADVELDPAAVVPSPGVTDSSEISADESSEHQSRVSSLATSTPPGASFGKPFKITWVSTERLPFYRTRGLRNPWNTNREVKIARDGTELEPSVGRKLVGMFNTVAMLGKNQQNQQNQYLGMMPPSPGQGPAYRPY